MLEAEGNATAISLSTTNRCSLQPNFDRRSEEDRTPGRNWHEGKSFQPRQPSGTLALGSHIWRGSREMPGFPVRSASKATCAAFIEESRIKLINVNKSHRKSGGVGPHRPQANRA